MKNNKLIPIVLLLSLFACEEKEYSYISEDEKPNIYNGDTICFKSNKNEIDSFIVKRIDDFHISDKRYYYENITLIYERINVDNKVDRIYVLKTVWDADISIEGNYYPSLYESEIVDIIIGEKSYTDVYFLEDYNNPDTVPARVYYTYKEGVIRYDFGYNYGYYYFEIIN